MRKDKKKMLFVNNYGFENTQIDNRPKHHLWGFDVLKEAFCVRVFIFSYSPLLFKALLTQFRVLLRSFFVDIVYTACGCATDGLALCKKLKLCNPKIFRVVHHPFKIRFVKSYDGLIFISKEVMNIAIQRYPHMKDKMHYVFWGPDLEFYDNEIRNISQIGELSKYFFISNGKTRRDYDCFSEAMQNLDAKALIICDEDSVPKYKNPNTDVVSSGFSYVNAISSRDSVREYLNAKVVVIPVKANFDSLIGLTSLVDALAMGLPTIMSDNTMIGVDLEQEQIGLLYKAGNSNDLRKQLQKLLNNTHFLKEMSNKARIFAEKNDYKSFKNCIIKIIDKDNN